jgi:hypothetical protein
MPKKKQRNCLIREMVMMKGANWQCINRKLTGRQANTPLGSIPMDAVQLKAQGTTKFKS